MNHSHVDAVVDAVLYEGYILYPYRSSSVKNQQRFTFGRVYPEAYSLAENGAEPCTMQTQCLVRVVESEPVLDVRVRFLQPIARQVGELPVSLLQLPSRPQYKPVRELRVGEQTYQTWQEASERDVPIGPVALAQLAAGTRRVAFAFEATTTVEPVREEGGEIVGVIERRAEAIEGIVELAAEQIEPGLFMVTVAIANHSPMPADCTGDAVVMHTMVSTHTVLHADRGEFVSMTDPPAVHAAAAARCVNTGTWPVLVGTWPVLVGTAGACDTLLSSPIILYDYPEIAEASPGALCDSTEIDEILTLRIMTMTDAEKQEMRGVDEYARRILERTDSMAGDDLMRMHGVVRPVNPLEPPDMWSPFDNGTSLDGVRVGGVYLRTGDRVRIRPKSRADIMDMTLAGMTAMIEAIERDFEDRLYLALVLEDDPGRDLGMMRQPGHRFFYAPEEVEPL